MTAHEFEEEMFPLALLRSGLILFEAAVAARVVRRCFEEHLRFLGVEAFRLLDDGRVQPAMELSNISFGYVAENDGKLKVVSFERQPRSDQRTETIREDTLLLITEGANAGYSWFEVSIEDPITDELLFFRKLDVRQEH